VDYAAPRHNNFAPFQKKRGAGAENGRFFEFFQLLKIC